MNPYFEFQNHKLATYKSLFANDRPMTDDENIKVKAKARTQWAGMALDEQRSWLTVYRSSATIRALGPIVEAAPSTSKRFQGVWQALNDCCKHEICPSSYHRRGLQREDLH